MRSVADLERRRSASYSRRSNAFSIRSSLPPRADDAAEDVARARRARGARARRAVGARPAVDRHRLLARRVGQRVGVRDEVEEVVGVQVRDDDRVDVDVVAEAAQLGEHAVAAVEQQRRVALLDEVAAAGAVGVLPGRRLAQDRDPQPESLPLWTRLRLVPRCRSTVRDGDSRRASARCSSAGALVSGIARRSLPVADGAVRARRASRSARAALEVLDVRPHRRLRRRPGDRRADRDPVPRRARGRGRDAPDASGACRCASSCSRCRSPRASSRWPPHVLTDLSWTESFLLGALLSPTDPVLSSSVVTNPRVPRLVRHSLNLESGLNDGLALPAVLAFVGGAGGRATATSCGGSSCSRT